MTHKKVSYVLTLAVVVLSGFLWTTNVHATGARTYRLPAVLKCQWPIAEDTTMYVRVAKYEPGVKVVYRCTRER